MDAMRLGLRAGRVTFLNLHNEFRFWSHSDQIASVWLGYDQ